MNRRYVFISYRREDGLWAAGRLEQALAARLGRRRVFRDTQADPGAHLDSLQCKAAEARVVVLLIGRRWEELRQARIDAGQRDYVYAELEAARRAGVPVIPVLLDRTTLPPLEGELRSISQHLAKTIDDDHWDARIGELVQSIRRTLWLRRLWGDEGRRLVVGAAAVTAAVLGAQYAHHTALRDTVATEGSALAAFEALEDLREGDECDAECLADLLHERRDALGGEGRSGASELMVVPARKVDGERVLALVDAQIDTCALEPSIVERNECFGLALAAIESTRGAELEGARRDRLAEIRERLVALHGEPPSWGDDYWVTIEADPAVSIELGCNAAVEPLCREFESRPPQQTADEWPRWVGLESFEIGRREVGRAEIAEFMGESPTTDQRPSASVSWYAAAAYASWRGARLPSSDEWELAARGGCSSAFWRACTVEASSCRSEDPLASLRCTLDGYVVAERLGPVAVTTTVGARAHPFGLEHAIGNVAEWTSSWYTGRFPRDTYDFQKDPSQLPFLYKVVRGGSYRSSLDELTASRIDARAPWESSASIGFRLARDVGPESGRRTAG